MMTAEIRYPRAEQIAAAMPLPLMACPVTRELYGYAAPVLDIRKAVYDLSAAGIRGEARAAALLILEARADALTAP